MPSFFERSPFVPRLVTTGLLFGLLLLLLHVLLPRQLALVATFGMEHETDNQSEGLKPSTYPDCRQTYASLSLSPVCLCTQKTVDVATHSDPAYTRLYTKWPSSDRGRGRMWSVRSRLPLQPSARRFYHASIRRYFIRRNEESWWKQSPSVNSGFHFRAPGSSFERSFRVRHVSVTAVARDESEQGEGRHSKVQCPRCSHPLPSATSVASM